MKDSIVTIPRAVQLVIDDVGWREGWNISDGGGPFRAGVDRLLGPEDYSAVADLGAALSIRPQCAMVLCEWDKENVCARFPTTTHQGSSWDNSSRAGEWADESARIFVDRSANIEFAMHGVGHEHWENGVRTRAEWFGANPDQRWPWKVLQGHLECFRRIMAQYDLDPDHGISPPVSFVPCAFRYYWDDEDAESTGALMKGAGVRFCSTPFSSCYFAGGPSEKPGGGLDHGLMVLDRGNNGVQWYYYSTIPEKLPTMSICGIHWPNLLMPDPERNGESVKMWVEYLKSINDHEELMLARNMAETCSQWLYCNYAFFFPRGGKFYLDAARIPETARENRLVENPIFKMRLSPDQHISAIRSEDCHACAYWEVDEWAFFALQMDNPEHCSFRAELGSELMNPAVLRQGTYDVLGLEEMESNVSLSVRVYGDQVIHLRLPFSPTEIKSENPNLRVCRSEFDSGKQIAVVHVRGGNIHGEEGLLIFQK